MVVIKSTFIGDFKTGDNIVFNLKILKALYAYRAGALVDDKVYLQKPIIVFNVSIVDAVLHDFYSKVRTLTREGVANVTAALLAEWRGMTIDKLELYVTQAKKHNLFGEPDAFYEELHDLRKLRNRVHIQNEKHHFEPDDRIAFDESRMIQSEKAVEKVLRRMEQNHARNLDHVQEFELPWNAHFV